VVFSRFNVPNYFKLKVEYPLVQSNGIMALGPLIKNFVAKY